MPNMFIPTPITAPGVVVPVLPAFTASSTTSVTAGSVQAIAVSNTYQMFAWSYTWVYGGTGNGELVQILSVDQVAGKITAYFQNSHSGTYYLVSQRNNDIGALVVGNAGTGTVLTLYDGPPALYGSWGNAGRTLAIYTFNSSDAFYHELGFIYNTLFYTVAGSGFNITLWDMPHGT